MEANTSISSEYESQSERLAINIEEMIQKAKDSPHARQSSTSCRIYKIPNELRQGKNDVYTPKVISIGPLHHGNSRLEAMEEHKVRYLEDYLSRTAVILEHLVRFIGDKEEIIRSCYVGDIDFSSDDFVKMILLDACFILELFLKYSYNSSERFEDFDAT